MCFIKPKIPTPPPQPTAPNPNQAEISAQEEMLKKQRSAMASRGSTIKTSSSGDSTYGTFTQATKLVA